MTQNHLQGLGALGKQGLINTLVPGAKGITRLGEPDPMNRGIGMLGHLLDSTPLDLEAEVRELRRITAHHSKLLEIQEKLLESNGRISDIQGKMIDAVHEQAQHNCKKMQAKVEVLETASRQHDAEIKHNSEELATVKAETKHFKWMARQIDWIDAKIVKHPRKIIFASILITAMVSSNAAPAAKTIWGLIKPFLS
jgi:DNA repair ATPase RecN